MQHAVMKNISFDKTNSRKALGRTEAAMSNVESRDFGEERVTSCDSITWFSLLWRKKKSESAVLNESWISIRWEDMR